MLDKKNFDRILAIKDFYNIKFHSYKLDHFIIFLAESTVVWPSKRLQFFADVVEMSSHAYIERSCESLGVLHNIQRIPYKSVIKSGTLVYSVYRVLLVFPAISSTKRSFGFLMTRNIIW